MKRLFTLLLLFVSTLVVFGHTIILNSGRKLTVIIDKVTSEYVYYHTDSNPKVRPLSQSIIKFIDNTESQENTQEASSNENMQDAQSVSLMNYDIPKIKMRGTKVYVDGKKVSYDMLGPKMHYASPKAAEIAANVHYLNNSRKYVASGCVTSLALIGTAYIYKNYFEMEADENDSNENLMNACDYVMVGSMGAFGGLSIYLIYTYIHPWVVVKKSVNVYNSEVIKKSQVSISPYIGVNELGFAINF